MKKMIETRNITFSYSEKKAITDISVSVRKGEVLAVLGPNGSGKTTFIKMLAGLLKPDTGKVFFDGRDIREYSRKQLASGIAYVPQSHREAFGYSASEIVLMGRMAHLSLIGRYGNKDRIIAAESLEKMSVGHLHDRPYTKTSGGERQLILIARAVAQEAEVLVMDEPSSSLDFGNQLRLLSTIRRLAGEGYSIVFSTHHPDHALSVADRVIMIKNGKVVIEGDTSVVRDRGNIRMLYDLDECFDNPDSKGLSRFFPLCA